MKRRTLVVPLALLVATIQPLLAQSTSSISSDAAAEAWASDPANGYNSAFQGDVRYGGGSTWEMGLREGDAANPDVTRNVNWQERDRDADHYFLFGYTPTDFGSIPAGTAGLGVFQGSLNLYNPQSVINALFNNTTALWSTVGQFSDLNTMLVRAYDLGGYNQVALSHGYYLTGAGNVFGLPTLQGDSNGNWLRITDPRFSQGFVLAGRADFTGTYSSQAPAYSFEIGSAGSTSVTPEPISMALLGTGLVGVAAARRRRRKNSDELPA